MSTEKGPIETRDWERQLVGRAVEVDAEGLRLFGYDVARDLARHYSFGEVLLLALTGELPDDARSRAFEAALVFGCASSIAEAPIHAAALARLCGVRPGGVLAVSALALGEQSDALVARLEAMQGELSPDLRAKDDAERVAIRDLASLITIDVPLLAQDPNRDVAVVAVLRACGLTTPFQLASALNLSRLMSALAEASRVVPGDFKNYAIDTPHFEYDPTCQRERS